MKVSKSSLIAAAAFTGLLGGTMTRLNAEPAGGAGQHRQNRRQEVNQAQMPRSEKHSCAGKNSCEGKGGCNTSDNGCKAKNSCKGKGGCATDGSKKA